MTAKEQQFINLVRGLAEPEITLSEIKAILSSGSLPILEVQHPEAQLAPSEIV